MLTISLVVKILVDSQELPGIWGFLPSQTNPSSVFCFFYCQEETIMACTSTMKGSTREKHLARTNLYL